MKSPKTPKPYSLATLFRVLKYTRKFRTIFLFTIVLSLVLAAMAPLRPYLIQESVDVYIKNQWFKGLLLITAVQIGILIVETIFRFLFAFRISLLGQGIMDILRNQVFKKIIEQDTAFFDQSPVGTLTTRTINDVEAINDIFTEGLLSIVADILTIIAILLVMFWTDWLLTLVCLSTLPLIIFATYWFKESVKHSFNRVRNAVASINAFAQEHISGMYIVQAFAAENREALKFDSINKEHRNANIKSIFAQSVFFPIVEIILSISLGLLVWWGSKEIIQHNVTSGIIIAFVMYINLLFRPIRMMADKFNTLQMGLIAAERIFKVLDTPNNISNSGTHFAEQIDGEIVFEKVCFEYKVGIPILKDLSFKIDRGSTVAIVGNTGAGKSSIVNIINRMYDIKSGAVLIDGVEIREYEIKSLRSQIGMVLQDVFLFSGTILDNITLKDDSKNEQEVISLCKSLGIHEMILQLPNGYQFNVGERGGLLSQGQKQLISFARALISDPTILILDEATSSIDSDSEILVQQAIGKMIKNRTSIVIAHRLSTIRNADQILMLDKGVLLEQGSHADLMKKEGAYYALYTAAEKQQVLQLKNGI